MAISLLPKDRQSVENKISRRLLNIGAVLLAVYLIVMATAGGVFVYVSLQNRDLTKTREALAEAIKNNQGKEEKYVILKDRLSSLSALPEALDFREALDLLPELIGTDLTIEGINLVGGDLKLVIGADDTFELEQLVNNFNKNAKLAQVTMDNLDLSATGEFITTLSVRMK